MRFGKKLALVSQISVLGDLQFPDNRYPPVDGKGSHQSNVASPIATGTADSVISVQRQGCYVFIQVNDLDYQIRLTKNPELVWENGGGAVPGIGILVNFGRNRHGRSPDKQRPSRCLWSFYYLKKLICIKMM